MRRFLAVWTGQALSSLATGVIAFALSIEIYRQSGSISHFALAWLCTSLPGLLLAPLTGTLVDRCSRGAVLASAEALSALVVIALLVRATVSTPPLAWLYLAAVGQSCSQALRWPALQALAGGMVPPERLARGAGLLQLSDAATQVLSPSVATLVVSMAGLPGTLCGSLVAYSGALVALAVARPGRAPVRCATRSLVEDWREAARFVAGHGDLRRLLGLFAGINFLLGIVLVASPPWLLGVASPRAAGLALSAASAGMLIAGLRASCGERRSVADPLGRIRRQACVAAACVALAGLLPSALWFAGLGFVLFHAIGVVNTTSQGLWLSRVPSAMQGRVFSLRRLVALSTQPIAYVVAGPLCAVFSGLSTKDGPLISVLGRAFGRGPTAGLSLLFPIVGIVLALFAVTCLGRSDDARRAGRSPPLSPKSTP